MKILFATASINGGGVFTYATEFISLFSSKHELFVVSGNKRLNEYEGISKSYKFDCGDTSVQNAKSILEIINNLEPDIVINSNAKVISLIVPYVRDKIKVITVSHSLKYSDADNAAINHKYIDRIIALSTDGAKYLDKKYKVREKTVIIPNFVSIPHNADLIKQKKKNSSFVTIVFPGGCSTAKYPELVVKIVDKLLSTSLNYKFYWLGNTRCPLHRFSIVNKVPDLFSADKRLIFTGKIEHDKSLDIIQSADVFLFPSRREGCPISLLEAMCVGCIPIVSDFDNANKEIVNESGGYIIPHKDVCQFVSRVEKIIENKEKYIHYYDTTQEYFKKELSPDIWYKRMHTLLLDQVKSHSVRHNKFSITGFLISRLHLKFIFAISLIQTYLEEGLPTYFSITRFALKKKMNGSRQI